MSKGIRNIAKMVQRHSVLGWDNFIELVTKLEPEKKPISVLFSGDKDETGVSWCPYCNQGKLLKIIGNRCDVM